MQRSSSPLSLLATCLTIVLTALVLAVLLQDDAGDTAPTIEAAPATTPATAPPTQTSTADEPSPAAPSSPDDGPGDDGADADTTSGGGDFVLESWLASIPTADEVGGEAVTPGRTYALWTDTDVTGVTALGGRSAAVRTDGPVTIAESVLGGATDGLKPAEGTTLVDSVVSVAYGEGAHADHIQVRGDDRVTVERVRFVAENSDGATDVGWNAAIFVHDDATDWVIRDVLVEAGRPEFAISSWFPIRLYSGSGTVERVVVDRAAMKSDNVVGISEGVVIEVWRDVYIREPDGSLTPVPEPTA